MNLILFVLLLGGPLFSEVTQPHLVFSGGDIVPDEALKGVAQAAKKAGGYIWMVGGRDDEDNFDWFRDKMAEFGADPEKVIRGSSLKSLQELGATELAKNLKEASALYVPENAAEVWENLLLQKETAGLVQRKVNSGSPFIFEGRSNETVGARSIREGADVKTSEYHRYPFSPANGLLPKAIIDPKFFSEQSDVYRLASRLLQGEEEVGLGVYERSSLILKNGKLTAAGVMKVNDFENLFARKLPGDQGALFHWMKPGESIDFDGYAKNVDCTPAPGRINPKARFLLSGKIGREPEMKELSNLVNPKESKVLIVNWAFERPRAGARAYTLRLKEDAGFPEENILVAPTYDEMLTKAGREKFLKQLEESSAIVFGGGDQNRYIDLLERMQTVFEGSSNEVRTALLNRLENGMVYMGGSAGMACTSDFSFTGATISDSRNYLRTEVRKGLGFVKNTVFDTHFLERPSRLARLMGSLTPESTMGVSTADLGIGAGEYGYIKGEKGKLVAGGTQPVYVVNRIDSKTFRVRMFEPGQEIPMETCRLAKPKDLKRHSSPLDGGAHGARLEP